MKVTRTKPYVCVDVDFADHYRFQATKDVEVAAGTWLRCLAHSRAQEQDGLVTEAWVRRTFPRRRLGRIEELVAVGLLLRRDDGNYEIHAYAPRNQTRARLEHERGAARTRMRTNRAIEKEQRRALTPQASTDVRRTIAVVPNSTSLSSSVCLHSSLPLSASSSQEDPLTVRAEPRADTPARPALPASERALSGPLWLSAFSDGITEHTGRPCTTSRVYLGTLERLVTHHAPERDPARATAWLRAEAKAFAALWDGKHPAKGLTPDGLERWLNEGRQRPPVFGRPRIVQPPPEEWHEDDWSDLGAEVGE